MSVIFKKIDESIVDAGNELLFDPRNEPGIDMEDMFWNVSEMTSEDHIAMGANNYSIIKNTDFFEPLVYDEPSIFLGFRCVAEIVDE